MNPLVATSRAGQVLADTPSSIHPVMAVDLREAPQVRGEESEGPEHTCKVSVPDGFTAPDAVVGSRQPSASPQVPTMNCNDCVNTNCNDVHDAFSLRNSGHGNSNPNDKRESSPVASSRPKPATILQMPLAGKHHPCQGMFSNNNHNTSHADTRLNQLGRGGVKSLSQQNLRLHPAHRFPNSASEKRDYSVDVTTQQYGKPCQTERKAGTHTVNNESKMGTGNDTNIISVRRARRSHESGNAVSTGLDADQSIATLLSFSRNTAGCNEDTNTNNTVSIGSQNWTQVVPVQPLSRPAVNRNLQHRNNDVETDKAQSVLHEMISGPFLNPSKPVVEESSVDSFDCKIHVNLDKASSVTQSITAEKVAFRQNKFTRIWIVIVSFILFSSSVSSFLVFVWVTAMRFDALAGSRGEAVLDAATAALRARQAAMTDASTKLIKLVGKTLEEISEQQVDPHYETRSANTNASRTITISKEALSNLNQSLYSEWSNSITLQTEVSGWSVSILGPALSAWELVRPQCTSSGIGESNGVPNSDNNDNSTGCGCTSSGNTTICFLLPQDVEQQTSLPCPYFCARDQKIVARDPKDGQEYNVSDPVFSSIVQFEMADIGGLDTREFTYESPREFSRFLSGEEKDTDPHDVYLLRPQLSSTESDQSSTGFYGNDYEGANRTSAEVGCACGHPCRLRVQKYLRTNTGLFENVRNGSALSGMWVEPTVRLSRENGGAVYYAFSHDKMWLVPSNDVANETHFSLDNNTTLLDTSNSSGSTNASSSSSSSGGVGDRRNHTQHAIVTSIVDRVDRHLGNLLVGERFSSLGSNENNNRNEEYLLLTDGEGRVILFSGDLPEGDPRLRTCSFVDEESDNNGVRCDQLVASTHPNPLLRALVGETGSGGSHLRQGLSTNVDINGRQFLVLTRALALNSYLHSSTSSSSDRTSRPQLYLSYFAVNEGNLPHSRLAASFTAFSGDYSPSLLEWGPLVSLLLGIVAILAAAHLIATALLFVYRYGQTTMIVSAFTRSIPLGENSVGFRAFGDFEGDDVDDTLEKSAEHYPELEINKYCLMDESTRTLLGELSSLRESIPVEKKLMAAVALIALTRSHPANGKNETASSLVSTLQNARRKALEANNEIPSLKDNRQLLLSIRLSETAEMLQTAEKYVSLFENPRSAPGVSFAHTFCGAKCFAADQRDSQPHKPPLLTSGLKKIRGSVMLVDYGNLATISEAEATRRTNAFIQITSDVVASFGGILASVRANEILVGFNFHTTDVRHEDTAAKCALKLRSRLRGHTNELFRPPMSDTTRSSSNLFPSALSVDRDSPWHIPPPLNSASSSMPRNAPWSSTTEVLETLGARASITIAIATGENLFGYDGRGSHLSGCDELGSPNRKKVSEGHMPPVILLGEGVDLVHKLVALQRVIGTPVYFGSARAVRGGVVCNGKSQSTTAGAAASSEGDTFRPLPRESSMYRASAAISLSPQSFSNMYDSLPRGAGHSEEEVGTAFRAVGSHTTAPNSSASCGGAQLALAGLRSCPVGMGAVLVSDDTYEKCSIEGVPVDVVSVRWLQPGRRRTVAVYELLSETHQKTTSSSREQQKCSSSLKYAHKGFTLMRRGLYERASKALRKAYAETGLPQVVRLIAICERYAARKHQKGGRSSRRRESNQHLNSLQATYYGEGSSGNEGNASSDISLLSPTASSRACMADASADVSSLAPYERQETFFEQFRDEHEALLKASRFTADASFAGGHSYPPLSAIRRGKGEGRDNSSLVDPSTPCTRQTNSSISSTTATTSSPTATSAANHFAAIGIGEAGGGGYEHPNLHPSSMHFTKMLSSTPAEEKDEEGHHFQNVHQAQHSGRLTASQKRKISEQIAENITNNMTSSGYSSGGTSSAKLSCFSSSLTSPMKGQKIRSTAGISQLIKPSNIEQRENQTQSRNPILEAFVISSSFDVGMSRQRELPAVVGGSTSLREASNTSKKTPRKLSLSLVRCSDYSAEHGVSGTRGVETRSRRSQSLTSSIRDGDGSGPRSQSNSSGASFRAKGISLLSVALAAGTVPCGDAVSRGALYHPSEPARISGGSPIEEALARPRPATRAPRPLNKNDLEARPEQQQQQRGANTDTKLVRAGNDNDDDGAPRVALASKEAAAPLERAGRDALKNEKVPHHSPPTISNGLSVTTPLRVRDDGEEAMLFGIFVPKDQLTEADMMKKLKQSLAISGSHNTSRAFYDPAAILTQMGNVNNEEAKETKDHSLLRYSSASPHSVVNEKDELYDFEEEENWGKESMSVVSNQPAVLAHMYSQSHSFDKSERNGGTKPAEKLGFVLPQNELKEANEERKKALDCSKAGEKELGESQEQKSEDSEEFALFAIDMGAVNKAGNALKLVQDPPSIAAQNGRNGRHTRQYSPEDTSSEEKSEDKNTINRSQYNFNHLRGPSINHVAAATPTGRHGGLEDNKQRAANTKIEALSEREMPLSFEDLHKETYTRSRTVIGSGAFGLVMTAMDDYGNIVAMKVMPLDDVRATNVGETQEAAERAATRRLTQEVAVLAEVRHPNIAAYVSAAVLPQHFCILMEYLSGGSLRSLISNAHFSRIPTGPLTIYLRGILKGLHYLHETAGYVHCDIKPDNLMLAGDGTCKITDFGTAVLMTEEKDAERRELFVKLERVRAKQQRGLRPEHEHGDEHLRDYSSTGTIAAGAKTLTAFDQCSSNVSSGKEVRNKQIYLTVPNLKRRRGEGEEAGEGEEGEEKDEEVITESQSQPYPSSTTHGPCSTTDGTDDHLVSPRSRIPRVNSPTATGTSGDSSKAVSTTVASSNSYGRSLFKPLIRGTPRYMAPEAALGEWTPACDIYSLGITTIELATGQHPYRTIDGSDTAFLMRLAVDESLRPLMPPPSSTLANSTNSNCTSTSASSMCDDDGTETSTRIRPTDTNSRREGNSVAGSPTCASGTLSPQAVPMDSKLLQFAEMCLRYDPAQRATATELLLFLS